MNTTSLEISKKLYEVSGWIDEDANYGYDEDGSLEPIYLVFDDLEHWPAYDTGFLLRKLPARPYLKTDNGRLQKYPNQLSVEPRPDGSCRAIYLTTGSRNYLLADGDTPEDALGLLAIKLFEEGVLG